MTEVRRFRPWIAGALVLIAGAGAFRLAASWAEREIASRIDRAAKVAGVSIRYDDLHVGLFPPVQLKGVTIEKAGQITALIDTLSATSAVPGLR